MIAQQAIRESSMLDERRGSSQGVMGGKRESWFQMKREEKKREQQNTKKGLTRTLRIMAPSTLYNPPPPRPNYRYPCPHHFIPRPPILLPSCHLSLLLANPSRAPSSNLSTTRRRSRNGDRGRVEVLRRRRKPSVEARFAQQ